MVNLQYVLERIIQSITLAVADPRGQAIFRKLPHHKTIVLETRSLCMASCLDEG